MVNSYNIVKTFELVQSPQSLLLFVTLLLSSTIQESNSYLNCISHTVFLFAFYYVDYHFEKICHKTKSTLLRSFFRVPYLVFGNVR